MVKFDCRNITIVRYSDDNIILSPNPSAVCISAVYAVCVCVCVCVSVCLCVCVHTYARVVCRLFVHVYLCACCMLCIHVYSIVNVLLTYTAVNQISRMPLATLIMSLVTQGVMMLLQSPTHLHQSQ